MNCFIDPCQCDCEKENIRTELIIIMKQRSREKKYCKKKSPKKELISTVAMEPKYFEIKTHNLFKSKKGGFQIQNRNQFNSSQAQNNIKLSCSTNCITSVNSLQRYQFSKDLSTNLLKIKQSQKLQSKQRLSQIQPTFKHSHPNKGLKEKCINIIQEGQTERKTMKKNHNIAQKQINYDYNSTDKLQTTKRNKKRNSIQIKKESMNSQLIMLQNTQQIEDKQTKRKVQNRQNQRVSLIKEKNIKEKNNTTKQNRPSILQKRRKISNINKQNLPSIRKQPIQNSLPINIELNKQKVPQVQNLNPNVKPQLPQSDLNNQLNQQIEQLKQMLSNLKKQEQTLLQQKYNKQIQFIMQYANNQDKKKQLHKNSRQRYEQLRQLKELIQSCKKSGF